MKEKDYKKLNILRVERIRKIKDVIYKVSGEGGKLNYNKIIADFCLQEGLSRRTVKEYIDLLIDSGQIKKDGDFVY